MDTKTIVSLVGTTTKEQIKRHLRVNPDFGRAFMVPQDIFVMSVFSEVLKEIKDRNPWEERTWFNHRGRGQITKRKK